MGALIGGLVGGPAGSAALGAGLGALVGSTQNSTKPLPLETALAQFLAKRALKFGGMERLAWNALRVVYGRGAAYFFVDAVVSEDRSLYASAVVLDDALYDAAVYQIHQHVGAHGVG